MLTDLGLYFRGYRHIANGDSCDYKLWQKTIDVHEANVDDSFDFLLMDSVCLKNCRNSIDAHSEIYGKAVCLTENGQAFSVDYDCTWPIEDMEKHACSLYITSVQDMSLSVIGKDDSNGKSFVKSETAE